MIKVDVHALGTFNRLAREGAEQAADSLAQLSGVAPSVESTRIDLVSLDDIADEFGQRSYVGVTFSFNGDLQGRTVLVMDRACADKLLSTLPGDDSESTRTARVEEVGNILFGGFLDGWADYLGTAIDFTPPEYVEGTGTDVLPPEVPVWDDHDHVFAFTSRLEAAVDAVEVSIVMFPEYDSFQTLIRRQASEQGTPIPFDKLAVFNRMTKEGAKKAAGNISTLTGIETTVDVSQISFTPIEDAPRQLADEKRAGVVFELEGLPSGYALILFDEPSAKTVADELVPSTDDDVPDDGELSDMHQSAIKEIGNIMTSGFTDGWANLLDTSIDHLPPQFVHDVGGAIMDPIAAKLGQTQDFAFIIDSTIRTADREIGVVIYAIPDETELTRALTSLSTDVAESGFAEMEASYEDL